MTIQNEVKFVLVNDNLILITFNIPPFKPNFYRSHKRHVTCTLCRHINIGWKGMRGPLRIVVRINRKCARFTNPTFKHMLPCFRKIKMLHKVKI